MSGRLQLDEIEKYTTYQSKELQKKLSELEREKKEYEDRLKIGIPMQKKQALQSRNEKQKLKQLEENEQETIVKIQVVNGKIDAIKINLHDLQRDVALAAKTEKGIQKIKNFLREIEKNKVENKPEKKKEVDVVKLKKEEIFKKIHPEFEELKNEVKQLNVHLLQLQEKMSEEKNKASKKKIQTQKEILSTVYHVAKARLDRLINIKYEMEMMTLKELESKLKLYEEKKQELTKKNSPIIKSKNTKKIFDETEKEKGMFKLACELDNVNKFEDLQKNPDMTEEKQVFIKEVLAIKNTKAIPLVECLSEARKKCCQEYKIPPETYESIYLKNKDLIFAIDATGEGNDPRLHRKIISRIYTIENGFKTYRSSLMPAKKDEYQLMKMINETYKKSKSTDSLLECIEEAKGKFIEHICKTEMISPEVANKRLQVVLSRGKLTKLMSEIEESEEINQLIGGYYNR